MKNLALNKNVEFFHFKEYGGVQGVDADTLLTNSVAETDKNKQNYHSRTSAGANMKRSPAFMKLIDLDRDCTISQISANAQGGGISLPFSIRAFVSVDKTNWKGVGDLVSSPIAQSNNYKFSLNGLREVGRYVFLITQTADFYCTFDEVEVFGVEGFESLDSSKYTISQPQSGEAFDTSVLQRHSGALSEATANSSPNDLPSRIIRGINRDFAVSTAIYNAAAKVISLSEPAAITLNKLSVIKNKIKREWLNNPRPPSRGLPYCENDALVCQIVADHFREKQGNDLVIHPVSDPYSHKNFFHRDVPVPANTKMIEHCAKNDFALFAIAISNNGFTERTFTINQIADAKYFLTKDTITEFLEVTDDALESIATSFKVAVGVTKQLLIKIPVASNAATGLINHTLTVSENNTAIYTQQLEINVHKPALTNIPDVITWSHQHGGSGVSGQSFSDNLNEFGVNFRTLIREQIPWPKRDASKQIIRPVQIDTAAFDAFVDARPEVKRWALFLHFNFKEMRELRFGTPGSPAVSLPTVRVKDKDVEDLRTSGSEYEAVFKEWITAIKNHLVTTKNWSYDKFCIYLWDEAGFDLYQRIVAPACEWIHEVDANLKTFGTHSLTESQLNTNAQTRHAYDIHCSLVNMFDLNNNEYDAYRAANPEKAFTVYTTRWTRRNNPLSDVRRLSLNAYKRGLIGFGGWAWYEAGAQRIGVLNDESNLPSALANLFPSPAQIYYEYGECLSSKRQLALSKSIFDFALLTEWKSKIAATNVAAKADTAYTQLKSGTSDNLAVYNTLRSEAFIALDALP